MKITIIQTRSGRRGAHRWHSEQMSGSPTVATLFLERILKHPFLRKFVYDDTRL
jgi:hypothetical protein